MQVFKQYSDYYDLLYHDKDYSDEVEYVLKLIGPLGKVHSRPGMRDGQSRLAPCREGL
jgi:hypothetical protein